MRTSRGLPLDSLSAEPSNKNTLTMIPRAFSIHSRKKWRPFAVSAARRTIHLRLILNLLVLGLAGFVSSRTVEASSCHLDERPSLGILLPGRSPGLASRNLTDSHSSPRPAFHRSPCPGESSHSTPRTPLSSTGLALVFSFDFTPCLVDELDSPSWLRPSQATYLPLERPPRD